MRNPRIPGLLALLVICGCSPGVGDGQAAQTPSAASPGSVLSVSPSAVAASPSARDPFALSCILPVISTTTSPDQPPGGWISFPDGQFARDQASLPGRLNAHVPSYDRAFGRWVPVEYQNVAPDGASYILHNDVSVGNDFYLVDVKTGTRTFALSGDGPPQAPASWTVVEYASEGVYFWSTGMVTVPGLWLLDPANLKIRLIDGSHYWGMVAGNAAWAEDRPFGGQGTTYKIYRLDLASGQVTTWYESSTPIRLLSPTPDGDVLITYGEYGSAKIELLAAPNQLVPVDVPPGFPSVTEANLTHPGVWIPLLAGGVALYMNRQVRRMADSPAIFTVAGGCW